MSLCGILENILSDLIFLVISLLVGSALIHFLGRKKLLSFFGAGSTKRLVVYLSNLRIPQYGALGIDGQERSYEGFAAAFGEMQYAITLKNLFSYLVPSGSQLPGVLGKLLVSDMEVDILHSPIQESRLDHESPLIVLGSPAYNAAARYAERVLRSPAKFRLGATPKRIAIAPPIRDATSVSLSASPSGQSTPETTQEPSAIIVEGIPPMTDHSYGFVERIIDAESNRSVFYVAGLSENATMGSAHFLILHWRRLSRKHPADTPFLVMLRVEPTDPTKATVVFEL